MAGLSQFQPLLPPLWFCAPARRAGVVRAIDCGTRARSDPGLCVTKSYCRYGRRAARQGRHLRRGAGRDPRRQRAGHLLALGVPQSLPAEARRRNFGAHATCPLVTKVHREAEIHRMPRPRELIGHAGHPEVVGTLGQLPAGTATLIETIADVDAFTPRDPAQLAYVTQTTLSIDDAAEIVARLKARFPQIVGPHKEDICYATTNRQEAVKRVAPQVDAMIVVGAPTNFAAAEGSGRACRLCARPWCNAPPISIGTHSQHRQPLAPPAPRRRNSGGETRACRALHRQRGDRFSGAGVLSVAARAARTNRVIAWPFTPTLREDPAAFADYDIGELLSYKGTPGRREFEFPSSTPPPGISSLPCTRSAWRPQTCRSSSR